MKSEVRAFGVLQVISNALVVMLAGLGVVAGEVRAQGGPDVFFDVNYSLNSGMLQTGCALAVDPVGPYNSFVFRDYTSRPGFPPGFYLTTVSPVGGVQTHYAGLVNLGYPHSVPFPVRVSRDGRNVAYIKTQYFGSSPLRFSQDYGATFNPIPLPQTIPYIGAGVVVGNRRTINNMVFGSDGNLYVFYVTSLYPATGQPWDRYRLELLVVDPNGVTTHRSLATLSGMFPALALTSRPQGDRFLDVVATATEVIAIVSVGPTYQANSAAPAYADVPAAFVIDVATQTVQTISFGGTLGGPNMATLAKTPVEGETMLASDGENLFMINYGLPDPISNAPTYMIREFTDSPGKFAKFFINTAAPGDQPYMDLEAPALQFGTPLNIGNGVVHQISAKWPVLTPRDHSVDVYGYTEGQLQLGLANLDVQRARIVNPNSGVAPLFPTILNDFPISALAQVGLGSFITEGWDFFPGFSQRYSTNSIADGVTTTFCQMVDFPGITTYSFHITDVS